MGERSRSGADVALHADDLVDPEDWSDVVANLEGTICEK
jgi:hypothetical protein